MQRAAEHGLAPRLARSGGAVADLEVLLRVVVALLRVGVWGLMVWTATAYPALTPAVSGLIAGDLLTWIVRRALRWRHESHLRVMLELTAYAGILLWWADALALPARLEERGVYGLALLGAIAVKTLPAVYLWLHGEE